jgi:hypothetical protein
VAEAIDHLPSKHEALSSNPSAKRKNETHSAPEELKNAQHGWDMEELLQGTAHTVP